MTQAKNVNVIEVEMLLQNAAIVAKKLPVDDKVIAWKNSRHLATLPLVSPTNDI